MCLTVGSLFSGIGGLDLGLERAGMVVKWQVENDPYCVKVLEKHWPGITRYRDIKGVDWSGVERVDLICGGFPCQDLSHAGKRAGLKGAESGLWFEMFCACIHVRPRWILIENVHHAWRSWVPFVRAQLSAAGYRSVPLQLSAAESAQITSAVADSFLPTPTASSYGSSRGGGAGRVGKWRPSLSTLAGGPPHPEWLEAMMGFPAGWTEVEPSAMPSCPKSPSGSVDES